MDRRIDPQQDLFALTAHVYSEPALTIGDAG
jgi:hypothetical protein